MNELSPEEGTVRSGGEADVDGGNVEKRLIKNIPDGVNARGFGKRLKSDLKNNMALYIFSVVVILNVIIFTYVPMAGIYMAFTNYRPVYGLFGSEFVGFEHIIRFVKSPWFSMTIVNTLRISVLSVAIGFPIPIIFALLLNQVRCRVFKRFVQTATYLPHFISTVVMCGMIIMFLSPSTGLYGQIARLFGYSSTDIENLMGSPAAFPWIYVLSDVWQHTGWDAIIYIAAISAIDMEMYDAAKIDGASRFDVMVHIDLPSIAQTIVILFILRIGGLFGVGFEKVYLLQNTSNQTTSEVISTYVYKIGLVGSNPQYSYAAAIGLFNSLINLVLLVIVNTASKIVAKTSLF